MKKQQRIRILFDANPIANGAKSGIGYYSSYLLQSLAESYPDEIEVVAHYYNFLGRKKPSGLPQAPNIHYRQTRLFPGKVTNALRRFGIELPFELLTKCRGDALIFPNFLTLPSIFKSPTVVTIHDLCFVAYPQFVAERNLQDLRRYVPVALKRADLVLTVSEFSKQAIAKTFGLPLEHILVTPVPPFEQTVVNDTRVKELVAKLGINKPFLLFVGNIEPRKNLEKLVEAYLQLPKAVRDCYALVLAGGRGWKNEKLLNRISELQGKGLDILMPGYISDEERSALYQSTSLVLLPSLYEGFGMPILEAFQFGAVVACSDIPVLHEVAAEAAFYFDPEDPTKIAACITDALQNESMRSATLSKQAGCLAAFSWQTSARQLYTNLQELV